MTGQSRSSPATPRPDMPMPCKVQGDAEQRPVAATLYGATVDVELIDERWADEEFWWRDDPVVPVSYQVTLEDGQGLTIFKTAV